MLLQKSLGFRNSDLIIKLLKKVFEIQLNNIRLNNYVSTNMSTLYFVNSFYDSSKDIYWVLFANVACFYINVTVF